MEKAKLETRLRMSDARVGEKNSELHNKLREVAVLNSKLNEEKIMRKKAVDEKTQLEKEKGSLEYQVAARKRTWQNFKEIMDSEHVAESSVAVRGLVVRKKTNRADLMVVAGDEFTNKIRRTR
jgi:hypothetical protein